MLRRHGLDPVEGEDDLEIVGLLGPQRAVIVEGGDALGHRHEIGSTGGRDPRHEVEDRLPDRAVVPRRQRIGLRKRRRGGQQARGGETGDERSALHANSLWSKPKAIACDDFRRLDRGPQARVERPSLDDKRLIVDRRSLRAALRALVETTGIFAFTTNDSLRPTLA
jgi:hypothetical protein